jgi:shikimate dehydrogenase
MHAAAYRVLRLPHTYEAIRVQAAEVAGYVDQLRAGAFDGFNVTVPHKSLALACVDEVHGVARMAGAANTLVRLPSGKIRAHNTDAPALALELRSLASESADPFRGGHVLVLGAGGAARSAVVAVGKELGAAEVTLRARNQDSARRLAEEMSDVFRLEGVTTRVIAAPLEPNPAVEARTSAIVQATSAGMERRGEAPTGREVVDAVAWSELSPRCVALDVVYAPPETPFVLAAREVGMRVANGIGMLAWQGALAFELWLDIDAPYNAMLTALV